MSRSRRPIPPPRPRGRRTGATTIADVARASGFSPMTVSRVLNGDAAVREETRDRVRRAAAKLNYTPNLAARALAGAGAVRIGLLYANPSAAYLGELLVGALDQARASHVQLVVERCEPATFDAGVLRELADAGVSGLLLPPPLCDSEPVLNALARARVPAVAIASGVTRPGLPSVRIDDRDAAATMTRHLIAMGHVRIGFVAGNPDQTASAERLAGYRDALAHAGLPYERALVKPGRFTYRSGTKAAEALLALRDPPTAIFASNDDMASAAVAVAHRRGLDVPRDLTVCGFDDTAPAQSIWPELTTIRQPIAAMAQAAVRLLVAAIAGRDTAASAHTAHELLPFALVRRESDAPPPRRR